MLLSIRIIILLLITSFCLNAQETELDSLIAARVALSEQYRKQDKDYIKAIELLKAVEDSLAEQVVPTVLRHVYHKLGVNYFYYGNPQKALNYATKALELHKEVNGEKHVDVVRAYSMCSAIFRLIEEYDKATSNLSQAIVAMEYLINKNMSQDTLRLIKTYDN